MSRLIIFAGKVSEAVVFAQALHLRCNEWLYPHQPQHIYGLDRGTKFVRIGTWTRHTHAQEFMTEAFRRGFVEVSAAELMKHFTAASRRA